MAMACDPGPPFPALEPGQVLPLGTLLEIARQREAAAAVCRAKHAALIRAWPAANVDDRP